MKLILLKLAFFFKQIFFFKNLNVPISEKMREMYVINK